MTIKIKGGHRIDHDKSGAVFLTDDSDERVEVDRERDIRADSEGFSIPLVGGFSTSASAEEAFIVSQMTHQIIIAGARRFRVTQFFGEVS